MKKVIIYLFLFSFLFSCGEDVNDKSIENEIVSEKNNTNVEKELIPEVSNEKMDSELISEISFSNADSLPSNTLFISDYYEKTGNTFFINSNYTRTYSNLVEYSIKENKIINTIFSPGEYQIIHEYDYNDTGIVFSVLNANELLYYQDIYYYDINSTVLTQVNTEKLNQFHGNIPLRVKMSNNYITWIQINEDNQTSNVVMYDISSKTTQVIDSSKYVDGNIPFTIFFNDISEKYVIYDKVVDNKLKIVFYNYKENKEEKVIEAYENVKLHYNGVLNEDNGYIALYGQGAEGDIIYVYYLEDENYEKIVGFHSSTYLLNDSIQSLNNEVYYTVQLNTSGNINEHYYTETYNLNDHTMEQKIGYLDVNKNGKYTAFLKYDEQEVTNLIHFELHKN